MPKKLLPVVSLAFLASLPFAFTACKSAELSAPTRVVVTKLDDLPRHTYKLPVAPSLAIQDEKVIGALLAEVARDVEADLAGYDIQDRTTKQRYAGYRLGIALVRGEWDRVPALAEEIRSLEEKPALKLVSGTVPEAYASGRKLGLSGDALKQHITRTLSARYAAMPYEVVGTELKETKASYEIRSAALIIGQVKESLDVGYEKTGTVSGDIARGLIGMRNQLVNIIPIKESVVAALEKVIAANHVEKPDRWTERLAVLPENLSGASPVRVAVWDSGVNPSLFPGRMHVDAKGSNGIAYDLNSNRVPELVFPMGEAEARLDGIVGNLKGFSDLQANIDSPEASALKRFMSSLKPEQVKPFLEDLSLGGNWSHGSHVAGITMDGNPFARLVVARITFDHRMIPEKPTIEQARKDAAASREAIQYLRDQKVRAVNMSWGGSLRSIEGALEANGVADPEERRKVAREIFEIGKVALRDAMAEAKEILWVAAAGNSDNNVEFDEFIPSSFQLPNMITVGAVDKAGEETSFSSFGPMVNVHANGFEVDSYIPDGRRLPFSGTSMAAPQVTNLAAKLFAVNPKLTPEEAKALIMEGAEKNGRVNLIHPRKTLELAGAKLK